MPSHDFILARGWTALYLFTKLCVWQDCHAVQLPFPWLQMSCAGNFVCLESAPKFLLKKISRVRKANCQTWFLFFTVQHKPFRQGGWQWILYYPCKFKNDHSPKNLSHSSFLPIRVNLYYVSIRGITINK